MDSEVYEHCQVALSEDQRRERKGAMMVVARNECSFQSLHLSSASETQAELAGWLAGLSASASM